MISRVCREVVTRRYKRIQESQGKMPGLVLIDGGIGQLHAAQTALERLNIVHQPLASIAKREENHLRRRSRGRAPRA